MLPASNPADTLGAMETRRVMRRASIVALQKIKGPTIPIVGRQFYTYSPGQILKLGGKSDEAIMTRLARQVLDQKAPEVETAFTVAELPEDGGIIMSLIPGKTFFELWPDLDVAQRATVKNNLAKLLANMRKKRADIDYYGRPHRQPYISIDDEGDVVKHDFCKNRSDWDESRIRAVQANAEVLKLDQSRVEELAATQRKVWSAPVAALLYTPVLTHCDLSNRNILVDPETLEINGIIDWETANVAPAYVEFAMARLWTGHNPFWRTELLEVLEMVLRLECDAATQGNSDNSQALFEETMAAWKEMVVVERPAQGIPADCYETLEEHDEDSREEWLSDKFNIPY